MNRFLIALSTVALVGVAAPAAAGSLHMDLPNLSFPTQPAPDASQGCVDLTTVSGDICPSPAK